MKGDFTRFTHEPEKHYREVRKQQGRVDLDADWNEYVDILDYLDCIQKIDVVGPCGAPIDHAGFEVDATAAGDELKISPGRIYVRGFLCENDAAAPVSLDQQPDLPGYEPENDEGVYLAYLNVWKRHITAIEDPEIREVALSGPDTATRVKTVWQVKLERVGDLDEADEITCDQFCCDWIPEDAQSTGRMQAQSQPDADPGNICEVPAAGGYRGIENRLYRVEIHEGGTESEATFKWSRDNGTVVFPVQDITTETVSGGTQSTLKLTRLGKDRVLTIHPGDWVEVLGDETELAGEPGTLARIIPDGVDEAEQTITVSGDVSSHADETHLKVRRWDQVETGEISLDDGAVPMQEEVWIPLEKGVQVRFQSSGQYRTGDYWVVPARAALDDVIWPTTDAGDPIYEPRHGIYHHFCPLAILELRLETDANGNETSHWERLRDCRHLFPPLTKLRRGGCCRIVMPGEDVQAAINEVIAAGGGCVALCRGLHVVEGSLNLTSAEDLTVRGESPATILELTGTDQSGAGGIILNRANRVHFENMMIRGDDVPALLTAKEGPEGEVNQHVSLRSVRMLNTTMSEGNEAPACGILLTHIDGFCMEECSVVAQVGIQTLFGEKLPLPFGEDEGLATIGSWRPKGYSIGVHELHLRHSTIRFRECGIWIHKAIGCELLDCDMSPGKMSNIGDLADMTTGEMSHAAGRRLLMRRYEDAIANREEAPTNPAIRAFELSYPIISGCRMRGSTGVEVWLLLYGDIRDNYIRAWKSGVHAAWWHDTACRGNRIQCEEGPGFSWAAAYRPRVKENHIRATYGVQNVALKPTIDDLVAYLEEMVRMHGQSSADEEEQAGWEGVALWILLEEVVRVARLGELRSATQKVLNAMGLEQIPVLYYSAYFLYLALVDPELEADWPLPVMAMNVRENDIQTQSDAISLESFLPLGGTRVDENRLHSESGKGANIKAHRVAVNIHLLAFAWRVSVRVFLEYVMPQLRDTIEETEMPDNLREQTENFLDVLEKMVKRWGAGSEQFMVADASVSGNRVRSRRTGIESNIFELAVLENHVTISEGVVKNEEITDIVNELEDHAYTESLGTAMKHGSPALMKRYENQALKEAAWEDQPQARRDFADASYGTSSRTESSDLRDRAEELGGAVNEANTAEINRLLPAFVGVLQAYVDNYGIWMKGAGCRVESNHVLVPADAHENTWARGGIRFWDDESSAIWNLAVALEWLEQYLPGFSFDPLLGITETLFDNNEVIRGAAHGVEIREIEDIAWGLPDLRISNNQVQGMAGAGILIDEDTLALGVDITGNDISGCSRNLTRAQSAGAQGGIVVRNAALCHITDNTVTCASNPSESLYLFGIDLDIVYSAVVSDCHIIHNEVLPARNEGDTSGETAASNGYIVGAGYLRTNMVDVIAYYGGLRILHPFGQIGVRSNDVLMAYGGYGALVGLAANEANRKKLHEPLRMMLDRSPDDDLPSFGYSHTAIACQSNQVDYIRETVASAYLMHMNQSSLLTFTGNNSISPGAAWAELVQIPRGVVSHNMLSALRIAGMSQGVVLGNVAQGSDITVEAAVKVDNNVW